MPTSTVPMQSKYFRYNRPRRVAGFSLMEMTAVLAVVGMMAGIAVLTISQQVGKSSLKKEAGEIINTLKQQILSII